MTLDKSVKRKTVEYNELLITRDMLIELVRSQRIGVSDDVKIEFDRNQTIKMTWERSTESE
jgi:hypothetical protein